MLEEISLTNKIDAQINGGSFAQLAPAKQLQKLEEIFKDIEIDKNWGNLPTDEIKEKIENMKKLKKFYVEIVKANSEDRDVKAEILKRNGLVDFSYSPLPYFQTDERKKIEEIQNKKFKYILTSKDLKRSKNTYFDKIEWEDKENINGKEDFYKDTDRGLTVDGRKLSREEIDTYAKSNSVFDNAISSHAQQYLYFKNPLTITLSKKNFYILEADTYTANIETYSKNLRWVTNNSFLPIYKMNLKNNNMGKLFSIPGHIQTIYEKTDNGVILKEFKTSNSVLDRLVQGNIEDMSEKKLEKLVAKAKREESPDSLYHWYKEQSEIFLNENFQNKLQPGLANVEKDILFKDFLLEVKDFLATHPEFQSKFKEDKQFLKNLEDIRKQLSPKVHAEMEFEAFVRTHFGDGRKGDVKAKKNDPFTKENLVKYLNGKTPGEQLQILEKIFEYLLKNKNNLYTYTGIFDPKNTLTSTQQKHMGELRELGLGIVRAKIDSDKEVREFIGNINKLFDASRSNTPNPLKYEKTNTRKQIDAILDEKAGIPVKDDIWEIHDYIKNNHKNDDNQLTTKISCTGAFMKIENPELSRISINMVKKMEIMHIMPGLEIENFVSDLNKQYEENQVFTKKDYIALCQNYWEKTGNGAYLMLSSEVGDKFPSKGYRHEDVHEKASQSTNGYGCLDDDISEADVGNPYYDVGEDPESSVRLQ